MAESGTKDVLDLDDLRASSGLTGRRHLLSLLVENRPGVLARIAGLFSRRGFNIDTLAVGPTEDPDISRVTLTVDGAVHPIDQVTKQLHKLVNVIKIRDMEPDTAVAREMALFRINAAADNRAEIIEFAQIFRAHIVDVSRRSITVEVTGHDREDRLLRADGPPARPDRDGPNGRGRDRPGPTGELTAVDRHRRAPRLGRGARRTRCLRPRAGDSSARRSTSSHSIPAPSRSPRGGPTIAGSAGRSPIVTASRSRRSAAPTTSSRGGRAGSPTSARTRAP